MIVELGLEGIADWLGGDDDGIRPGYIGVGLSTTAPLTGDTVLFDEIYPTTSRNPATTFVTEGVITWRMSETQAQGSAATYAEHGLFTNSTTGVLFSRQTHPDLKKDSDVAVEDYIAIDVGSYLP